MKTLALTLALLIGLTVAPGHADPPAEETPTATPAARAVDAVPWDQVGPGWLLVTVDQGRWRGTYLRTRTRRLELVAPDGTRYVVHTLRLRRLENGYFSNDFRIADWLPEQHVVLLDRWAPEGHEVVEVELETGRFRSLTLRPSDEGAVGLLPDRSGVLSTSLRGKLHRVGWLGERSLVAERFSGPALTSLDGTLVVGAREKHERLVVVPLDGSPQRSLETRGGCYPVRWVDDTTMLASCHRRRGSQLRLVGLDGSDRAAAPFLPTAKRGYRGPSWWDSDVREVAGRVYYEGNGPCGGSFLTTKRPDGTLKVVDVPGATAGVNLLGVRDDRLLLAHQATCDSGRPHPVLSLFDPVSRDEEVVVELGPDEQWGRILPYGEGHAW